MHFALAESYVQVAPLCIGFTVEVFGRGLSSFASAFSLLATNPPRHVQEVCEGLI